MLRRRTEAKNYIPRPRFIKAIYFGWCRCGARIEPDNTIYRDAPLKLTLCLSCGNARENTARSQLAIVQPECARQKILDRIACLNALPKPLKENLASELTELKEKLKNYRNYK